jgi:hypothetical protein
MSMHSAASFRTLGSAGTAQNFFTIRNGGANRIVEVRRLVMQMDATAVLTTFMPIMKTCRIATATGGTALTKVDWGTTASHADIVVLGANASDGGAATAITATPGATMWQQYGIRLHTLVGQVLGVDNNVLSMISENYPVRLGNGEGLLVHIVAAAGTSNPATNHYFVQCAWEETAV